MGKRLRQINWKPYNKELAELENHVNQVSADGAYDAKNCWDFCEPNEIKGTFPPKKGARIKQHGNCTEVPLQRDQHIRDIRDSGKKMWKQESGYSRRSLAETAMYWTSCHYQVKMTGTPYRFKTILSDKLSSRKFNRQAAEAFWTSPK